MRHDDRLALRSFSLGTLVLALAAPKNLPHVFACLPSLRERRNWAWEMAGGFNFLRLHRPCEPGQAILVKHRRFEYRLSIPLIVCAHSPSKFKQDTRELGLKRSLVRR
jgi:hypothetical protein